MGEAPLELTIKPQWGYTFAMNKDAILQVVVETPEFIKQAKRCMDEVSRSGFINFIAAKPLAGDIIVGTVVLVKCDGRAIVIVEKEEEHV